VAKTLNSEGIDTEIISIGKMAVQGCIACGMCGRNGAEAERRQHSII
jgi:multimeric flavodoxin WrbA